MASQSFDLVTYKMQLMMLTAEMLHGLETEHWKCLMRHRCSGSGQCLSQAAQAADSALEISSARCSGISASELGGTRG